jgi:hypothetical protein
MGEEGMSTKMASADRRSFLKTGALAAAPLAAVVPGAAIAMDDSKARLARLEDERANEGLHRAFLRRLNGKGAHACGEFFACGKAPDLGEGLAALADAGADDPQVEFSADGNRARVCSAARAERDVAFTGRSTIERMARFQGQGSHRHSEDKLLVADYVKNKHGWSIESVHFA